MAFVSAVRERFRSYRPRLELVLFGLSLLGVLDVVHLLIQQNRAFADGCLGIATLDAAASNCAAVTTGPGSELLGVSNITWGFGFYLLVGVLTALMLWGEPELREWIQGLRTGVLTGGFFYSGYLTYLQVAQIETLCTLCLVSAVIATLLFAAQVAVLVTSSSTETPMSSQLVKRQIALFAYFVAAALVLVGADVVYFDGQPESSQRTRTATASGSAASPNECRLETSKTPVGEKRASLVSFQDITKGSAESDVTVIEYFDPNCPHCKDFHQTMKKLVDAHSDDVQFVFKPFPLRRSSLPEIQALYVAAQSGKFTEMLEAQYARQGRSGISMSDLRAIASEIGMNPDVLSNQVKQNEYRKHVLQQRKRAVKIGVDSTPTVLVNGHFLQSRTPKCMNTFIRRAKEGTLGSAASKQP